MVLKIDLGGGNNVRYTMNFSLFSVLIPVYNMEKHLGKCIYSVLEQTYPNFEVILINNGSTDDSGKICDRYAKLDERIKVYHQSRQGLLMVRRNAIAHASGDYYLFLDGNDYWDTNLLENLSRTIWNYYCDMVIFNYRNVTPEVVYKNKPVFDDGTLFDTQDKSQIFKEIIQGNELINIYTIAVKNNIVEYEDYQKYKKIKEGIDLIQLLPILYKAKRILYIDKPMYNSRVKSHKPINNFYLNKIKDITIVHRLVLKYMELLGLTDRIYLNQFYSKYLESILLCLTEINDLNMNFTKKKCVFNKVQNIPLYKNSIPFIEKSHFTVKENIQLFLFKEKHYNLLILYENIVRILNKIST